MQSYWRDLRAVDDLVFDFPDPIESQRQPITRLQPVADLHPTSAGEGAGTEKLTSAQGLGTRRVSQHLTEGVLHALTRDGADRLTVDGNRSFERIDFRKYLVSGDRRFGQGTREMLGRLRAEPAVHLRPLHV